MMRAASVSAAGLAASTDEAATNMAQLAAIERPRIK